MPGADGVVVKVAELKAFTRTTTTKYDDDVYLPALLAGERACGNALHRPLVPAVAGAGGLSTRSFDASGDDYLWIDDCTEVTSVTENGQVLPASPASGGYILRPLNGLSDGGDTVPYDCVHRPGYRFVGDATRLVQVEARWGWPSPFPFPIVEMVKVVAKAILEGRDVKYGLVAVSEAGIGLGERDAKIVRDCVRDYSSHKRAKVMIR